MAVLLLADHDGKAVSQPTRSAVAACAKLGEVHVLVLGEGAAGAAPAAAAMPGVAKVLLCEDASLANRLAEPLGELHQLTVALPLLLILVAFLMVSTIRYPSFKQVNWETKTRFQTFVIIVVAGALIVKLREVAFFFLFLGYIAYGLFAHYHRAARHTKMRVLRKRVVKMREETPE